MMQFSKEHRLEFGLFALAFVLALVIRLLRLGELPLNDNEALWAMQAFDLMKGLRPEIGAQPAYVLLTAFSFFILQASNFAARLIPALFGAALTFVPFYFQNRLGRKPAIMLAFFMAFDPGLLALSRMAGTPIIALTAVLFAWGLWRAGNSRAAGVWAGIGLLAGPQLWPGLIGLAVAAGLLRGFFSREEAGVTQPFDRHKAITFGGFAVGTYLIVGSMFLLATGGLGAGLAAIPAYFSGWVDFSDIPGWRLLLALLFYEILALLLAVAHLIRGILRGDLLTISLGVWLVAALVLALAYPSRQVADLAWALIPLLALAALEVSNYLVPVQDGTWETFGMAAFTAAILAFAFMNYSSISLVAMEPVAQQLRWGILAGSIALLGLSVVMVAYGWSVSVAVQGSVWGLLAVFSVYTLSTALAAGGLRTYRTTELWSVGPNTKQAQVLVTQMNDISRWKNGVDASLDVTLAGVNSPSLRWVLRDWPAKVLSTQIDLGNPSMIIGTNQNPHPELEANYRGQEFTWRTYPAWDQGLSGDWLRWSILHEFPQGDEKIILWTRNDIYIDSQNNQ